MKKLMMFAAAMTIVGGAFAECEDPVIEQGYCAMAWDVKISVKSTAPEALKGYTITNPCEDPEDIDPGCYRKIGKYSYQGLLYTCECGCDEIEDALFYLWEKKAKRYLVYDGALVWDFRNVVGKKQKDAEGFFTFDAIIPDAGEERAVSFTAAGFGKWDSKYNRLKSLSGQIVGQGAPPNCSGQVCEPAAAFLCIDLTNGDADLPTAFAGTFSIKYSSSKSKAFGKNEGAAKSKYLPSNYLSAVEPEEPIDP